jgi:hypothetical protein
VVRGDLDTEGTTGRAHDADELAGAAARRRRRDQFLDHALVDQPLDHLRDRGRTDIELAGDIGTRHRTAAPEQCQHCHPG